MHRGRPRMLQVCAVDFTAFHFLGGLLAGARDTGWDVAFACADGPWAHALRDAGFEHWPIPIVRSMSPVSHLRAVAALAWRLRRNPQDVVHTHTPIGGIIGRAAAITSGGRSCLVHTLHGLPLTSPRLGMTEQAFLWLERALAPKTTWWFSQATGDATRAASLGIVSAHRLTVIGNGVDLERFRPDPEDGHRMRSELGIDPRDAVVVSVSRLVREKGVLDLAEAAARMQLPRRIHFLVVGTALPSDRTSVVRELGNHAVTRSTTVNWRLLGHRSDVERLLRAADVFVLASYREGLPRSVIEALASGTPVVATDIPACRELLDPSVGRLVPLRDPSALARELETMIQNSEERARMSREARLRAIARHDELRIVEHQLEIMRSLLT